MTDVKKYACNRLYLTDGERLPQSVVTVGKDGKFKGHAPLAEETSATEWIGGAIVLSDKESHAAHTDFQAFLRHMSSANPPLYAWHISEFNFQEEAFTPQSIIRRL